MTNYKKIIARYVPAVKQAVIQSYPTRLKAVQRVEEKVVVSDIPSDIKAYLLTSDLWK